MLKAFLQFYLKSLQSDIKNKYRQACMLPSKKLIRPKGNQAYMG